MPPVCCDHHGRGTTLGITQLSVFLENKAGRIAEVVKILADQDINIVGFSLADTGDYGIARMVVNREKDASRALREAGFTTTESQVICARIPNRPGSLAALVHVLAAEGIDIEYLYLTGAEHVILKVDDLAKAEHLLRGRGFELFDGDQVI